MSRKFKREEEEERRRKKQYEAEENEDEDGVALLEGSYCDRAVVTTSNKTKDEKQFCFSITYHQSAGQRQYDLKADTEADCIAWIEAIRQASYSKMIECKEELEQKHLHLLQILDSERQAKWHYVQQTEEHTAEIKKLKNEDNLLYKTGLDPPLNLLKKYSSYHKQY
ncbi:Hypothetical predicted protein [Octopus vulgaris]|uniref:PH domain-containing protein n=1 Tax=Octopus vulgaris TaxID=6645 RepID=A0AA36EZG9_OCTVU|nr:Hypothetical predicted protein [Octopus vulgaris]